MIERISSITIITCSAALHVYWLRCACLLALAKSAPGMRRLQTSLDADAAVLRGFLYSFLAPETWIQRLDFQLLGCWCRVNRPFSTYAAREVMEDMGVVIAGIAQTLARPAEWSGEGTESCAWVLRRPVSAHPIRSTSISRPTRS